MDRTRLDKLSHMLAKRPEDTFLLYGLAMEHMNLGELDAALVQLDRLLAIDAAYVGAYQLAGRIHEQAGRTAEAREIYRRGIERARAAGDGHSAAEMQGAIDMLG